MKQVTRYKYVRRELAGLQSETMMLRRHASRMTDEEFRATIERIEAHITELKRLEAIEVEDQDIINEEIARFNALHR